MVLPPSTGLTENTDAIVGFSTMSSHQRPSREGPKSSSAQRRHMTERRHEMAGAIRKQRKSHAVALKRRVGANASAATVGSAASVPVPADQSMGTSSSGGVAATAAAAFPPTATSGTISKEANALRTQIATISGAYIKAAGTADESAMLAALQSAVANADAAICSEAIDCLLTHGGMNVSSNRNDQETAASASAVLLADTLSRTLTSQDGSFATDESRLNAARVLTNLAVCGSGGDISAASPSSHGSDDGDAAAGDDNNYYGNVQETWCDILVRSSAVQSMLQTIVHLTRQLTQEFSQQMQQQQQMTSTQLSEAAISLCEQCCWAVGNLGGDSQRIRDRLHTVGAIRPLLCALRLGLAVAANDRTIDDRGNRSEETSKVVGLCRNAAWALSNLARGSYTSALPFLQLDNSPNMANHNESLLTPTDMLQLIAVHQRSRCDVAASNKSRSGLSTWADVSIECSWLLTLLTSKEDAAVDFIFRGASTDVSSNNFAFCASLASGLYKASNSASSPEPATAELALRCAVPCIRIAGNIAASCDGRYVPNLLGHYRVVEKLAVSLSIMIDLGARHGRDHAVLAAEACWAVGAMLVDAGTKNHPSTQSCEILVPALCNALTSASSRAELRREAASALCNAVAPPPVDADMMDQSTEDSQEVRDAILKQITTTDGVIPTLSSLLTCYDADAVFASLSLVNDILRRIGKDDSIKTRFEECNIVDALETVCDRASAASSYGNSDTWQSNGSAQEESAEIAADLIDDFFDEDGMDDDVTQEVAPEYAAGASTFAFGLGNAETPSAFDFGAPSGPTNSVAPTTLGAGRGRGRGRGRGASMPAWMSQLQN